MALNGEADASAMPLFRIRSSKLWPVKGCKIASSFTSFSVALV